MFRHCKGSGGVHRSTCQGKQTRILTGFVRGGIRSGCPTNRLRQIVGRVSAGRRLNTSAMGALLPITGSKSRRLS